MYSPGITYQNKGATFCFLQGGSPERGWVQNCYGARVGRKLTHIHILGLGFNVRLVVAVFLSLLESLQLFSRHLVFSETHGGTPTL